MKQVGVWLNLMLQACKNICKRKLIGHIYVMLFARFYIFVTFVTTHAAHDVGVTYSVTLKEMSCENND